MDDGGLRLSPAYDLVCSKAVIPNEADAALTLNGKSDRLRLGDFKTFGETLRIPAKVLGEILRRFGDSRSRILEPIDHSRLSPQLQDQVRQVTSCAMAPRSKASGIEQKDAKEQSVIILRLTPAKRRIFGPARRKGQAPMGKGRRGPRTDYDGAWKQALDRYLEPFLRLCFPVIYAGIDWSQKVIPRDTELQQIVRSATTGKRHVDKLVEGGLRVPRAGG